MTTDFLNPVRSALAPQYAIDRLIGRGGMAVVYLAEDRKHKRRVAVKVLRPELAATLAVDRFVSEIGIAATLSHPHILPLFDSGEADGLLYYVMPFVEGESLRTRLGREWQLPIDEAVRIAQQVASALHYAHTRGVVHRDIKPENILLNGDTAMVVDFGIGLALAAAGASRITQVGELVGTPDYMSPEQATGEAGIDSRTDVYSLGCVLFEMLTGEPPFKGPTVAAVIHQVCTQPPPSARALREAVPEALSAVVRKALAKAPTDRFESASAFSQALGNPALAALLAPADPGPRSIAVLPFVNLTGDSDQEYFCDGMTEEIINALAHEPAMKVAARTSSFAFKGKHENIRKVGEELKVSTVLEGSVRRTASRLRITAQLINVADGYHLWSGRYDRAMKDVFALQDELAGALAETLKLQIVDRGGPPLIKRGTSDLEAYHRYLRGRHFWYARDMGKALEAFEAAIAKDPNYALAHAGAADAYSVLAHYGFLPSQLAREKATRSAARAVEIDPALAEGLCSMGLTHTYFGWDFRKAEQAYQKALSLKPGIGLAHGWLGVLYGFAGRYDQAIAAADRAVEDEPLSPLLNCLVCIAHFYSRQFDAAIAACETALEVAPDFGPAHWCISLPYTQLGRHDEAIAALRKAAAAMRQSPWVLMLLGGALARAGLASEAEQVTADLRQRAAQGFIPALCFGWIHLWLGEQDKAYEWLDRAFSERNAMAWFFAGWPGLEWMRAEPRWNALLERYGVIPVGTETLDRPRIPMHTRITAPGV